MFTVVFIAEHLLRGTSASRPPSALQRVSNIDSSKAISGSMLVVFYEWIMK